MRVTPLAAVLLAAWCCAGAGAVQDEQRAALGWLAVDGAASRVSLTELRYYEGQPANFTCHREHGTNASVQISYYSDEAKAVSTTFRDLESVEMYMKLRRANNNTVLSCAIRSADNDTNTVQVRLLLVHAHYDEGFEVNGLRVKPAPGPWGGETRFVYPYFWEERMTVRLVRDARQYAARCTVSGDSFPSAWLDHVTDNATLSSQAGVNLVNTTLTAQQSGAALRCRLRHTARGADPFEPDRLLTLTFIYYDLVPFVGGMTMANVELMYKTNATTVLFYDNHIPYTGNDTHYLTCNPDTSVAWWIWNTGEVDHNPDKIEDSYPRAFRLYEHAKWTLLQCRRVPTETTPDRMTHVWLHRNDPTPPPPTSPPPPPSPPPSSPPPPPSPTTTVSPSPSPTTAPTTTPVPSSTSPPTVITSYPSTVLLSNTTETTLSANPNAPDGAGDESAWWREIVSGVVALLVLTCGGIAVCVTWYVRSRGRAARSSRAALTPAAPRSVASCGTDDPEYEYIRDLPTAPPPHECADCTDCAGMPVNIALRPPYPLPPEAIEESLRYRHYETPYEWRMFRFGAPRCRCGRCSEFTSQH